MAQATTKGKTIVTTTVAKAEVATIAAVAPVASKPVAVMASPLQKAVVTPKPSLTVSGNVITEVDSTPAAKQLEKEIMDWYPDVQFVRKGNMITMVF